MANISEERTPTLKRTLGLSGVVIIGIAWVTPLIVLATIGIIAQLSNGAAPTAYLITLVAMLFTAYSYGRMAYVHYQSAGSAYTYVGGEMGPRLGFLTGGLTLLAEETRDPRRTIPRAMIIVVLFFGALFVGVSYFAQLVHPGDTFQNADSAALELAKVVGGNLFSSVLLAGLIVGQFASGLAIQAGAARLLFAMGRDGALPRGLSRVLPRFRTPAIAISIIGITGLGALFLDVTTSTSFINFGAFSAFTLVNLSVIMHFLRHRPDG